MSSIKEVFVIRESITIRVDPDLFDELQSLERVNREGDPGPLSRIVQDADEQISDTIGSAAPEAHVVLDDDEAHELMRFLEHHEEFLSHGGRRLPEPLVRLWDELEDGFDRSRR